MATQITTGGARGRRPGSRPKKTSYISKSGRKVSGTERAAKGPAGKVAAVGAVGAVAYKANKKYQQKRYEKASPQKRRALTFRKNRRRMTAKGAVLTGTATGIAAGAMSGAAGFALGPKGQKGNVAIRSAALGASYGAGYGGVTGAAHAYSNRGRVKKKHGFESAAGVPARKTAPRKSHGVKI